MPTNFDRQLRTRDNWRAKKAFDDVAEKYQLMWSQLEPWQLEEREEFTSLLDGTTVLDVGCGPGRDLKLFNSWGLNAIGIDISKRMLKLAPHGLLVKADMRSLPFADECIHGLWACQCVTHIPKSELNVVLNEFFRMLKPKGVVFISVNFGYGERYEEIGDLGVKSTRSFYTLPELKRTLQRFTIIKSEEKRWGKRHYVICFARKENVE